MFFTILFDRAWEILDQNRRAYIVINTVFYGVMIVFMIFAVFDQPLQIAGQAPGHFLRRADDGIAGDGCDQRQMRLAHGCLGSVAIRPRLQP